MSDAIDYAGIARRAAGLIETYATPPRLAIEVAAFDDITMLDFMDDIYNFYFPYGLRDEFDDVTCLLLYAEARDDVMGAG